MINLLEYVHSLCSSSEELALYLRDRLKKVEYKKGSRFLKTGQVCDKLGFVQKGMFRQYEKKENKEICSAFIFEGRVLLCVDSFYYRTPCSESVQALTDSVVYELSYRDVMHACKLFPKVSQLMQTMMVERSILENRRSKRLRMVNATDRYKDLLLQAPEIVQRVSCGDVASYLGMTLVTLSRLKGKLAKGNEV